MAPASLEAIGETLAVAASAAAAGIPLYEGSAVDALREAYEAVKAAFDEALEPERQAVIEAGARTSSAPTFAERLAAWTIGTRPLPRRSGATLGDALLPLAGGSNFPPLWWRQG